MKSPANRMAANSRGDAAAKLDAIPDGMTCEGVHRAIVEHLLANGQALQDKDMLDIPCGQGDLVSTLRHFFPTIRIRGGDLEKPARLSSDEFAVVDASRPFRVFPDTSFDYVFSVSGVMEFDNTLQYFQSCNSHLKERGQLIVTNDNFVAIRDRIFYFWLGKPKDFQMFVTPNQVTWKIVPIHNLVRILRDAGFEVRNIEYVSIKPMDWLALPLALIIYPVQSLFIRLTRNKMPLPEKRRMYPFRSLLYRHYILYCEKVSH
jgi:SAM-dependent methyltransferase